jgi:Methyltransferase domain
VLLNQATSIDRTLAHSGVAQTVFHLGRFADWLGGDGEDALVVLNELLTDDVMVPVMEATVATMPSWETKRFSSIFQMRLFRMLLFSAIRLTRPALTIETGVLHGMTSLFLLRALELNGFGRLISIDLPSYPESGPANRDGYHSVLPPGQQSGWLVPRARYPQWDLQIGSTRDRLPLLNGIEGLGMFLHDSEHTTETMTFELEWAWPRLTSGGLLLCDNIEANTAFQDFCRRIGRPPIYFPAPDLQFDPQPRLGVLRK